MGRTKKRKARAPNGAAEVPRLVRMEKSMDRDVKRAAAKLDPPVNVNEYIRGAIRMRLKAEAEPPEPIVPYMPMD